MQVCFIFWIVLCLWGEYLKITVKNTSEKDERTLVCHT